MYSAGRWQRTPVFLRNDLAPAPASPGRPSLPSQCHHGRRTGLAAAVTGLGHLVLERRVPRASRVAMGTSVDPVMLEIFNNL